MSGRVRFVLVEPREAGNVGAAARGMKNFGFTELVLVGEMPQLEPVAEWWASGAGDVVAGARRVESLEAAIRDAHAVVATTSSRERAIQKPLTPAEVRGLRESLPEDQTLAIVFGREDRGLTAQELALCGRTAVIPTSDLHPVLNLAQSVTLLAWELCARPAEPVAPRALASAASIERLHESARKLLLDAGFLDPVNPDRIYDDLREIVARAGLDEREVTILLGMLRQMRWKIGN
ncbi:MAG: RNA methyltransferase [Thermoanaerobaculia bacterium]